MGRSILLILFLGGMMVCHAVSGFAGDGELSRARSLYFASATRNVFEAISIHETDRMEELFSRVLAGDFSPDVCG